jgi:hypothetical protein
MGNLLSLCCCSSSDIYEDTDDENDIITEDTTNVIASLVTDISENAKKVCRDLRKDTTDLEIIVSDNKDGIVSLELQRAGNSDADPYLSFTHHLGDNLRDTEEASEGDSKGSHNVKLIVPASSEKSKANEEATIRSLSRDSKESFIKNKPTYGITINDIPSQSGLLSGEFIVKRIVTKRLRALLKGNVSLRFYRDILLHQNALIF